MEFNLPLSVDTLQVGASPETLEVVGASTPEERVTPVSLIVSSYDEQVKTKTGGEEPATGMGDICCDMCQPPFVCDQDASDCICHFGRGVLRSIDISRSSCADYAKMRSRSRSRLRPRSPLQVTM